MYRSYGFSFPSLGCLCFAMADEHALVRPIASVRPCASDQRDGQCVVQHSLDLITHALCWRARV